MSRATSTGYTRSRLLAIAVVVLVGGALKLTRPVTLPLAFAVFLIALFWPLQRGLVRRMRKGAATFLTLATCLVAFGLFAGALWLCADEVAEEWPRYEDQFRRLGEQARSWLKGHHLPVPGPLAAGGGGRRRLCGRRRRDIRRAGRLAGRARLLLCRRSGAGGRLLRAGPAGSARLRRQAPARHPRPRPR